MVCFGIGALANGTIGELGFGVGTGWVNSGSVTVFPGTIGNRISSLVRFCEAWLTSSIRSILGTFYPAFVVSCFEPKFSSLIEGALLTNTLLPFLPTFFLALLYSLVYILVIGSLQSDYFAFECNYLLPFER